MTKQTTTEKEAQKVGQETSTDTPTEQEAKEEEKEEEAGKGKTGKKPAKGSKVSEEEISSSEKPMEIETNPLAPNQTVALGGKSVQMRDKLRAEKKVRVFIPLANGEKPGVTQSVIINGYQMYIRKGGYVEVPESVAEVLEVKNKQKMEVQNHPDRVGGDKEVRMTTYGS